MDSKKGRQQSTSAFQRSDITAVGSKRRFDDRSRGQSVDNLKKPCLHKSKDGEGDGNKKSGFGFKTKKTISMAPIKMSLGQQKKVETKPIKKPDQSVASVFNESSESEEEEMPLEARMRMKNVGKFTPTAAGPNSFGKGNLGFIDRRALLKKELEDQWQKTKDEDEEYMKKHRINMKLS